MTSLNSFIKQWAIYSKTAGRPLTRIYEDENGKQETIIFVNGYPMSPRAYVLLIAKSIFGNEFAIDDVDWKWLHDEARVFLEPLTFYKISGKEAFTIVDGLSEYFTISSRKTRFESRPEVFAFLTKIDDEFANHKVEMAEEAA